MALIDATPTSHVTVPQYLLDLGDDAINGELPADMLRSWDEDGAMFVPVSYAFQAFYLAAEDAGHNLRSGADTNFDSTGRYRTATRQVSLFFERFETPARAGRITKTYKGVRYSLKPGMANAATPKTSNHGKGLADDVASDINHDDTPEGITVAAITWAKDNQESFGIGLESHAEAWHRHWVGGNRLTQRVVDVLFAHGIRIPDLSRFGFTVPTPSGSSTHADAPQPTAPTVPTTALEEDDMLARIVRLNGFADAWLVGAGTPIHLTPELFDTWAPTVQQVSVEVTDPFLRSVGYTRGELTAL